MVRYQMQPNAATPFGNRHAVILTNSIAWRLPRPCGFLPRTERKKRYWTDSKTRIFWGKHSIEEYPLILPWEKLACFWVGNISFYVIGQHWSQHWQKGVALIHPFGGWFKRTRQDTKQLSTTALFRFSKSLFTLMQKLQKNIFSHSLCFSVWIWRKRQERVSHRRRGLLCKPGVKKRGPLWINKSRFFPRTMNARFVSLLIKNKISNVWTITRLFIMKDWCPLFLRRNCLLCQFRMCFFFSFRFPPSLPFTSRVLHHNTQNLRNLLRMAKQGHPKKFQHCFILPFA